MNSNETDQIKRLEQFRAETFNTLTMKGEQNVRISESQ